MPNALPTTECVYVFQWVGGYGGGGGSLLAVIYELKLKLLVKSYHVCFLFASCCFTPQQQYFGYIMAVI